MTDSQTPPERNSDGRSKRPLDGVMYSLAGTHFVEPKLNKADPSAAAEYSNAQSAYLAASGTLTQFNAILAAMQAAAFSATSGTLRAAIALALVLHVAASFILCWAARPVEPTRTAETMLALAHTRLRVNDTFKHYRRGWRMTMIALVASAAALGLFALHELRPDLF